MNFEINYVLPHWLYWSVLILLPLVVMICVDRSFRRGAVVSGSDTGELPGETPAAGY